MKILRIVINRLENILCFIFPTDQTNFLKLIGQIKGCQIGKKRIRALTNPACQQNSSVEYKSLMNLLAFETFCYLYYFRNSSY